MKERIQAFNDLHKTGDGLGEEPQVSNHHYQKGIVKHVNDPKDILYTLVLMGDKSDSIPRLVPPYELEAFVGCITDSDPWMAAVNRFGWDDVTRNLYLAVLPGPWCFDIEGEFPSPGEVFELVREGFWPLALKSLLREDVLAVLRYSMQGGHDDDDEWG